MANFLKNISFILFIIIFPVQLFAQSYTDTVRHFERLLREWKSDGYSTGSEKYTQLMSMVTEGCRMSEYVAKSFIDDNNASTFDIKAGSWFQYIKEKKISISLRDLSEKTDEDRKPIVYCWITYTRPGRSDKNDFVGFQFDGGKIFYIFNDDRERDNRIRAKKEENVVVTKPTVPFTITSCTVSNEDYDDNPLPMDAEHSQYLMPTITYNCTTSGSYDIYVKLYDANGKLRTGKSSPSGYTQVNNGVSLSSGSGSKKLKGWGSKTSGHWSAGNYRYEFYYSGTLLYTYNFTLPEKIEPPFTITACSVSNIDYDYNPLPMDAEHSQYLMPTITYNCTTSGSYDIYVKLYDANGKLSTGKSSPSGYSHVNSGVSLYSSGSKKLMGRGNKTSGTWSAGNYRFEFYYEGVLLYTHRFTVPAKQIVGSSGTSGKYQYIDLGLPSGTLWATCNVGANNPWEHGDHYAWGYINKKSKVDWDNYKFANGSSHRLTKYCTSSNYGNNRFVDNKTTLDRSDDVACQQWGSSWCIPTSDQLMELKGFCSWYWTTYHGKNGCMVTGPNGNTLFLPAAGHINIYGRVWDKTTNGYYYSRTLGTPIKANSIHFSNGSLEFTGFERWNGMSIRPVRNK